MGSKAARVIWIPLRADGLGVWRLPGADKERAVNVLEWFRYELTPTRKPKKPKSRRARRRKV